MRITMRFAGVLLAAVGCASAPSSDWDPVASASLKADAEAMLKKMDAGDFAGMLAKMDTEPIVYDTDETLAPVRAQGIEEVRAYFAKIEQAFKQGGMTIQTTLVRADAQATSSLGFCVLEFDQSMSMGGQTMGPFQFRGTLVARRVGDDWRWAHWHGGWRQVPVNPSAPPAAAPSNE